MSRPLRLEIPGGWYHVMNRGLRRHAIFADDDDRAVFLETLRQACQMFGVKVAAFCLMPNHYHLLTNTPEANLSRFMRHVNGVYTQRFNRKNNKDGPLFRGRYRALIVDADSYLLQVVRYIHLNPVKARICAKPDSFRWSSHRNFVSGKGVAAWLETREILKYFSARPSHARKLYKQFMKEDQDPELENFYTRKRLGWVLGSEGFVEKMKQKISSSSSESSEETPQMRKVQGEVLLERITTAVTRKHGVSRQALMESKRGTLNLPRNIALYLAWELSGMRQREIAEYFKAKSYRAVASQYFRIKQQIQNDKTLRRNVESIRKTCSQEKT